MAHRWGRAIVCVLLILVLLARSSTAECSFEYRRQPPSTTLSDCNPYDNNDRIVIVLECTVRRMDDISTTFLIRWFRENTTGAVEDLGLGDPDQPLGIDWFSRYHGTAFRTQPYSPSLLGKYWCQVINTTADPDQPLMRSNVFTLLAPEDYNETTCHGPQQEYNEICADELDNPQTLTMSSYHTTTYSIFPTPAESTIVTTITPALPTPDVSRTITPGLPASPVTSVIVHVVSGVSGGVLLVTILICCSGVILILVKRRRKTALATAGHDSNTLGHHDHTQLQLRGDSAVTNKESSIHSEPESHIMSCSITSKPQQQSMKVINNMRSHGMKELPLNCSSSTSCDGAQSALYQPLDTATTDYTSVYTTPTGRRGPPSVEVEGKMYSIVDPIKREADTTYDAVIKEPYYI